MDIKIKNIYIYSIIRINKLIHLELCVVLIDNIYI